MSLVIDWHWPYMAIVQPARNVCVHTYLLAPGDLHKLKKEDQTGRHSGYTHTPPTHAEANGKRSNLDIIKYSAPPSFIYLFKEELSRYDDSARLIKAEWEMRSNHSEKIDWIGPCISLIRSIIIWSSEIEQIFT